MLKKLIDVAAKREKADLILKNLNIINVLSGNIEKGDIAIFNGVIAAIGNYDNSDNITDCNGQYAMSGFIDAHVHIESTHLTPAEFAKTVVPCGTTTVIADPHEIANVCGIEGIKYIYDQSKNLPLDVKIMFPSCVPATPFETSGAVLDSCDMQKYLGSKMFFGVGEFMNYPGVINADSEVLNKLKIAKSFNKIIDGHASDVTGDNLNAYLAAGILTDHECTNVSEMQEKISKGMYILIREGSATKNLEELVKGVTPYNFKRCLMCTDDKTPYDLLTYGHIDHNIRLAVKCGIPIVWAVAMATINAAECYNLKGKGALSAGYIADIVLCDDLESLNIAKVYKNGKLAAEDKKPLFDVKPKIPKTVLNTVKIDVIDINKFKIKIKSENAKVIKIIEKSIITDSVVRKVKVVNSEFVPDNNLLKIAVVERHKNTGNVGLGIIEGFGLKGGAIALTVAHDSHNIIAIGDNDADMLTAVNELKKCGGGITVVSSQKIIKTLPLEIAGLISGKTAQDFEKEYSKLLQTAYDMGVNKNIEPFMTLSFMSLSVIPHLKVTDFGLFDVDSFCFTGIDA